MTTPVDQVREIAGRGYEDAIELLACIEILEAGNDPQVTGVFTTQPVMWAAKMVRVALFSRVLLLAMRPFDQIWKGDQHLAVAFELLEDPEVRAAVAQGGSSPADLEDAIRLYDVARADPRLKTLRYTRNKELAHLSERDPNISRPLNHETFAFARDVGLISEKLASGTGVASVELRHQLKAYTEGSRAFWAPWRKST